MIENAGVAGIPSDCASVESAVIAASNAVPVASAVKPSQIRYPGLLRVALQRLQCQVRVTGLGCIGVDGAGELPELALGGGRASGPGSIE